jgi:hypothetical protein
MSIHVFDVIGTSKNSAEQRGGGGIARENVSRFMNDWMRRTVARSSGHHCLEKIANPIKTSRALWPRCNE